MKRAVGNGRQQFQHPAAGTSTFLGGNRIRSVIRQIEESAVPPEESANVTSTTSITSSPSSTRSPVSPSNMSTISSTSGARAHILRPQTEVLANRQEIFSKISTSSISMKPSAANMRSFTRVGSERNNCLTMQELPTGDNRCYADSDAGSTNLSLTFSEVDDESDGGLERIDDKLNSVSDEVDGDAKHIPSRGNSRLETFIERKETPGKKTYSETSDTTIETPGTPQLGSKIDQLVKSLGRGPQTRNFVVKTTEPTVRTCRPLGKVGFGNLPNQVYRRSMRNGFEFCLMVVGESGLGKSTLVNSMFLTDIYSSQDTEGKVMPPTRRTVEVETHKVMLEEAGVRLSLTVVDTPGFGDQVDNTDCWSPITSYVDSQFDRFLEAETRIRRVSLEDSRVHACLYFIAPTGHGLRQIDIQFMKRLHEKVNIIPVIGKADACTKEELKGFKSKILSQLEEAEIHVYQFPQDKEEDMVMPFAVVGSNTVLVDNSGTRYRGRSYPWGTVNIEDREHCDFLALRSLLLAQHMQDLRDVTSQVHYERYRCNKLTALTVRSEEGESLPNKNPLAAMEDEAKEHEDKIENMKKNMEDVFQRKVDEKQARMNKLETQESERLSRERILLGEEKSRIAKMKEDLVIEKKNWEREKGTNINSFLLRQSTESLDGKKKKLGLSLVPFKIGRS